MRVRLVGVGLTPVLWTISPGPDLAGRAQDKATPSWP